MKYRVRLDLSFDEEQDAQSMMTYARGLAGKASSNGLSWPTPEVSYCEIEICRHDEGLPCERVERIELNAAGEVEPV